jgi:hypothetical protein
VTRENSVWVSPSATTFSCLCEACLDRARAEGSSFLEAIRCASVRGDLPTETDVRFVRCAAGHEVVVRRVDRPAPLTRHDARQLQLI